MRRFAVVAVLAACGDGRAMVGADAPPVTDSERGLVRVHVSGFVEKTGLSVYFQDRDSTISLATRTDANGDATGRLGPDGFVTLVAGIEPTLTLWTYTGVQPGDELEFYAPDAVHVPTPTLGVGVFANGAGLPPFALRTSCGGTLTVFDPLPITLQLVMCEPRVDFLLERGQEYRYAHDVDLATARLEFPGEFVPYAEATVTMKHAPGTFGSVSHALLGQGIPLETSATIGTVIDGEVTTTHVLPLPAGGTVLTEIDMDVAGVQHVVDWRPATTQTELVYDETVVAGAIEAPRYDATTTAITWREGTGTRGELTRATLHWLDGEHSRTRVWVVIGPRGEEAMLRVPLLPAADLVPQVEVPQTLETFVVGDELPWLRTHMHGRWIPSGVAWPAHGARGRVTWRSL